MIEALARLALVVAIGSVVGCGTGGPPPPVRGPFDGVWTSPDLGYDLLIDGKQGKAIGSSRAAIRADDLVLELTTVGEDLRISGKQLLPDGLWHELTGELKADGKIYCTDGHTTWILERKPHEPRAE